MNGYTRITLEDKEIGLKFGYHCIKWFYEACGEKGDLYYEGVNLTTLGIAKLIQCAYKNNCAISESKEVFTLEHFNEWAEGILDSDERKAEVTKVMEVFGESRYTKEFVDQNTKKKGKKKELTSTS